MREEVGTRKEEHRRMKVYLDNNVFVDIEARKYRIEDFLAIPDTEYFYSDAHMNELLEAKGNPKVSQDGRLELITKLCGQNYISPGTVNVPEFLVKDCREIYKLVDNPLRVLINKTIYSGTETFAAIREIIGFNSKRFNNEEPERVFQMIDERMQKKFDMGLLEYLYRTEAYGGALYGTLMNIVDIANYWKDSQTGHSDVARLCDASHAYSAQICDVLVTGDKRMRAKVKVVYLFLGVKTKVTSVDEFLERQTV